MEIVGGYNTFSTRTIKYQREAAQTSPRLLTRKNGWPSKTAQTEDQEEWTHLNLLINSQYERVMYPGHITLP